jgi:mRNA interferase MazF
MGKFAVGNIILVIFPFSNLKGQKLRPALVLAKVEFDNLILCQITSKPYSSKTSIRIGSKDFSEGKLPIASYIRPDKLFTADKTIIKKSIGQLNIKTKNKTLKTVGSLFSVK